MSLTAKAAAREVEIARNIIGSVPLPDGILDVSIQPGEDQDGDPILWVWFHAEDPNTRDMQHARAYMPFLKEVRNKLYAELDDYRPQVGIR